jgi:hypothetical protein
MRTSGVRAFTHRQLHGWSDRFRVNPAGEPFRWIPRSVLEETEKPATSVAARTTDPVTRAAVYVSSLLGYGWTREKLAALGFDRRLLDAGDAARGPIGRIRRFPARAGRPERLENAILEKEPRARAQAVKSPAMLGTPAALELIAGLREDPGRHVRACVEGVLRHVRIG